MPDDESLLFARSVEALRAGVETLGPEWHFFADVWNPSERWAEKTAEIRVRLGSLGTVRSFGVVGCRPAALADLLVSIASAGGGDDEKTDRALAALATRWRQWTPDRMREILAS